MINVSLTKAPPFLAALIWLAVVTPATAQVLFPTDNATMVNPDVQLKLTFKEKPVVGKLGKVRIYDAEDVEKAVQELMKY